MEQLDEKIFRGEYYRSVDCILRIGDTSVGYHAFKQTACIFYLSHIRGYANHLYLRQSYVLFFRNVV